MLLDVIVFWSSDIATSAQTSTESEDKMSYYSTSWNLNGKSILIESQYIGDKCPIWSDENYNHSIITVTLNDKAENFDAWGSMAHPEFDDEHSLKNIFQCLCNDALDFLWDETDDACASLSGEDAQQIIDIMSSTAAKLTKLGLTEDDMLSIVNDTRWALEQ